MSDKSERFVRWQSNTLTQMGHVIHTLLLTSGAVIGFSVGYLLNKEIGSCTAIIIKSGIISNGITFILLLAANFTRLIDFRLTTKKLRNSDNEDQIKDVVGRLGKLTWGLLYVATIVFAIASILIIVGFWQLL